MLSASLDVGLAKAELWDPKPYVALGADPDLLRRSLAVLFEAATTDPPDMSLTHLLPYLEEEERPATLLTVPHFPRSHALMAGVAEWLGNQNRRGLMVVPSAL